jgi:hypothetical protein
MADVQPCDLPAGSLLAAYVASGAYTDCYTTAVSRPASQAEFVEAFYTTAVFKLERLILKWLVSRPSTDHEAGQLGRGEVSSFAAWAVEARSENQVLLRAGRTRSWLMVDPTGTRLYFGSAITPRQGRMGAAFTALLGFHKIYSRVLLAAAASRLSRRR